jgi:hypothetical protein
MNWQRQSGWHEVVVLRLVSRDHRSQPQSSLFEEGRRRAVDECIPSPYGQKMAGGTRPAVIP